MGKERVRGKGGLRKEAEPVFPFGMVGGVVRGREHEKGEDDLIIEGEETPWKEL